MANEIDGAHVDSKAMDVLICLAESAPEVVTGRTLFERVWPRVVVSDNVLHQAIKHLRQALGDDARSPRCIETIPRRGYRLVAAIDWSGTPARPARSSPLPRDEPPRTLLAAVAACTLLTASGAAVWWLRADRTPAYETRSLAVLPFENLGPHGTLTPIADALVDDVLLELSTFRTPKLVSRAATLPYRDSAQDPRAIGAALEVGYVLEGTVRPAESGARVTVRLVRTEDGQTVWTQDFERTRRELLDTRPLGRTIAHYTRARALTDDGERYWLRHPGSNDPEAIDYFLRARREVTRMVEGSSGDWDLVLSLYDRAVEIDPDLWLAHVLIGNDQTNLVGWRVSVDEARERAYASLARAAEIHPHGTFVLSHWIYGKVLMYLDLDYDAAAAEYRAALTKDPDNPSIAMQLRIALSAAGHTDEAIEAFELERRTQRFLEAEPVEVLVNQMLVAGRHFWNCEWEAVRREATRIVDLAEAPRLDAQALRMLAVTEAELGRVDVASALAERAWELTGAMEPYAFIGPFAHLGQHARAGALLAAWNPDDEAWRYPPRQVRPSSLDAVTNYTLLGDVDNTVKWLRRAILEREGYLISHIRNAAIWEPMRSHPAFQDLLRFLEAEEARSRAAGRALRVKYPFARVR